MTLEWTALIGAWVAIVILAFAMSGLARQLVFLRKGVGPDDVSMGLRTGIEAPPIEGRTFRGEPTVLVFASSECVACERMWPELERLASSTPQLQFVAVFAESRNGFAIKSKVEILENQRETFSDYRVPATPFAVSISAQGMIREREPLGSVLMLEQFVDRSSKD